MGRRLIQAAILLIVLFAAAQLVRPSRTNPPIDPSHTIQAQAEWTSYPPDQQRRLLDASCRAVNADKMPGLWAKLRPQARLSSHDIQTICAAANRSLAMSTTLEAKVNDFLAQKRIAVVGVSRDNRSHPAANLIYRKLKRTGHDVFAVNPNLATFEDDRCYPDLKSIPGGVDGAVIVTRPEATQRIVRECGDAAVRRVWMHESMAKGSSVSPEAVDYCRSHDISVIAGACPMMYGDGVDFGHACMRWIQGVSGKLPV